MDKWDDRLSLFGICGSDARREAVLNVLEANSADVLDFLVFDTPVKDWDDTIKLSAKEMEFLVNMSQIEKNIEMLCGCIFTWEPC